jgi:hypothetical protein
MAITIRNRTTEAMIRELGERWGSGPSGVIKRLAERELQGTASVSKAEAQRLMRLWDEADREFSPPSEEEAAAMRHELDHMYDYLDDEAAAEPADRREAS